MILDLKAPHQIYKAKDGRRLTGVTTYLGVIAKPQLMKWYADEERKGVLDCVARGVALPDGPFAEVKRDKAADLGTVTHAQIEAYLNNDTLSEEGIPEDIYRQSFHGLARFREWWHDNRLSVFASEHQFVYESEFMSYGGTVDIVAQDQYGKLVLIDVKTTKKSRYWPYDEVYAQVAAYTHGVKSHFDVTRCMAVRVGKDTDDAIQAVEFTQGQIHNGWMLFTAAYDAYEAKKALARATKEAAK